MSYNKLIGLLKWIFESHWAYSTIEKYSTFPTIHQLCGCIKNEL